MNTVLPDLPLHIFHMKGAFNERYPTFTKEELKWRKHVAILQSLGLIARQSYCN